MNFPLYLAMTGQENAIKQALQEALAQQTRGTCYLVITFDRSSFS